MKLKLTEEYGEGGVLVWIEDFPGAFLAGETERAALEGLYGEVQSYLRFAQNREAPSFDHETERRAAGERPALFESERACSEEERARLEALLVSSAEALWQMYCDLPSPKELSVGDGFFQRGATNAEALMLRAEENAADCFAAIGATCPRTGDLPADRRAAVLSLKEIGGEALFEREGELWTLKKCCRRVIAGDRACARAIARAAFAVYGTSRISNPFFFRFKESAPLPLSPRLASLRLSALKEGVPTEDDAGLRFLLETVRREAPRRILEIGTAVGISAAAMAEVCAAHIVTIEKKRELYERAQELFAALGLERRVQAICGDAGEILPALECEFDFIFLDGPKVQYIRYLHHCKRLLRRGGVLFADDVLLFGWGSGNEIPKKRKMLVQHIREYVEAVSSDEELETKIYEIGEGIAVSRKL